MRRLPAAGWTRPRDRAVKGVSTGPYWTAALRPGRVPVPGSLAPWVGRGRRWCRERREVRARSLAHAAAARLAPKKRVAVPLEPAQGRSESARRRLHCPCPPAPPQAQGGTDAAASAAESRAPRAGGPRSPRRAWVGRPARVPPVPVPAPKTAQPEPLRRRPRGAPARGAGRGGATRRRKGGATRRLRAEQRQAGWPSADCGGGLTGDSRRRRSSRGGSPARQRSVGEARAGAAPWRPPSARSAGR